MADQRAVDDCAAAFLASSAACGPKGNVLINWHLIFAPRKVLEYVVVHELAHLKYRVHGRSFWNFLATLAPDYQTSKTWLDRHQTALSADFLASC
ncbi:M48 metallopeptidase family protein [Hyphomicrobium sp. 2TAF46]|uniref:M48 metallopeptidase family protein n=1 Tax=Hyphomicrobium sp. 2TAF46 TaxID=3233019 RepID=UPI003F9190B1